MENPSWKAGPEEKKAILESLEEFTERPDVRTFGLNDGSCPDYFIALWWSHYAEGRQITATHHEPGGNAINFKLTSGLDPITCLNEVICAFINARPGLKPGICLSSADAEEWTARGYEPETRRMNLYRVEELIELINRS